jgi:hypothetical protein
MRRSGVPVMFVLAGLALWFGPWRATAHAHGGASVEVVCEAAPVDLFLHGSDPLGSEQWFGGDAPATPISSQACRTSAWWRTLLGTAMLGLGLGSATRDRTAARVARLQAARA